MAKHKSSAGRTEDSSKLDQVVANARRAAEKRLEGYREQSLRIHPLICGRCGREFTLKNLHELTVHHKDHNHDNNPADGSNWENLCLYCHDNEHQRYVDKVRGFDGLAPAPKQTATFNPFANLADMLEQSNKKDK